MLIRDLSVFRAFMEGMGAALAVLVVVGTAQRYWGGGELDSAQGPGGWGMRLLPPTRRTLGDLNERINQQMTTVNQRLYDLEHAAFKEPAPGNEEEE